MATIAAEMWIKGQLQMIRNCKPWVMYPSKILSDKLQSTPFIADTVGTLSKCPH